MKQLFVLLGVLGFMSAANAEEAKPTVFSHLVFFDLIDDSPEAVSALIEGTNTYLAPHDGVVYFHSGARDADKDREVNDQDFDVSLTIIFESEAAQDAYQVTDAHKAFIETYKDNWERVRVFDSQ